MENNEVQPDCVLAQVVKVLKVEPIQNAERIDLATVLGWKVIIKKNEFQAGDLAIYFSINSILPKDDPNLSFLEGKRLKTVKMKGVYSQGLLGPLEWGVRYGIDPTECKEGDDLTEKLRVKKWIPDEEVDLYENIEQGRVFPSFLRKTAEARIQNCKIADLEGKKIVLTQKFDGTSTTYFYLNGKFGICGRNTILYEKKDDHYFTIAERYNLEEKMRQLDKNIALQGEIIGPKISGNRHGITQIEYYVFNIFNIEKQSYMNWDDVTEICKKLNLNTVPLIYKGIMKEEWLNIENLLKLANEQRYETGRIAEGLVLKTDSFEVRKSFKIISNEYLLKYRL